MVSTSEVVCNTSTPRDVYFSLKECDEDKTIAGDSVSESADNDGAFRKDRKKKRKSEVDIPRLDCS